MLGDPVITAGLSCFTVSPVMGTFPPQSTVKDPRLNIPAFFSKTPLFIHLSTPRFERGVLHSGEACHAVCQCPTLRPMLRFAHCIDSCGLTATRGSFQMAFMVDFRPIDAIPYAGEMELFVEGIPVGFRFHTPASYPPKRGPSEFEFLGQFKIPHCLHRLWLWREVRGLGRSRTATCWLVAASGILHRDCSCKP